MDGLDAFGGDRRRAGVINKSPDPTGVAPLAAARPLPATTRFAAQTCKVWEASCRPFGEVHVSTGAITNLRFPPLGRDALYDCRLTLGACFGNCPCFFAAEAVKDGLS